jgi:hypothetical protein
MFTITGYCTNHVVLPTFFPTGEGTGEERDQLNVTLKALSDEKEYQFSLDIGPNSKAPGVDQLDGWMAQGTPLTVLAASVRAVPFVHDTTPQKDGSTKKYARAGRKVMIGKVSAELDSMVVFQAYEIRPAGQLDLQAEAQAAHGAFLKQQAEYRKRSNAKRIAKAKESVEQRKRDASAKKAAS